MRTIARFGLTVSLAFHVLASLQGCATGDARANLDQSVAAFDRGEYPVALERAEKAASQATSTKDADEAAYMAGMSAFRLGDYTAAERWLTEATRAADRWTAGQAGVMLGNARLKLSRPREAGTAFAAAAQKLAGEDARKARIAAANAYKEAGDLRAADEQFRLADVPTIAVAQGTSGGVATSQNPVPPAAGGSAGTGNQGVGPYVLQGGAFRDRSKAEARADELRPKSVRAGLGEPRIAARRTADGSSVYAVQIGGFPDRRTAERALGTLGANGVVVLNASLSPGAVSQAGS